MDLRDGTVLAPIQNCRERGPTRLLLGVGCSDLRMVSYSSALRLGRLTRPLEYPAEIHVGRGCAKTQFSGFWAEQLPTKHAVRDLIRNDLSVTQRHQKVFPLDRCLRRVFTQPRPYPDGQA
jgi:hypothetical protein